MQPATSPPEGFSYHEGVLDHHDEAELLAFVSTLPLREARFHGFIAKRRVAHFGWVYSFNGLHVDPGPPIPQPLLALRDRVARLAGLNPAPFEEALVIEYPAGAGIGWHRDAQPFGPVVLAVSLGASCRFRLRREGLSGRETFSQILGPRSAYVLAGPARSEWEHSIPPVDDRRISITFRSLRQARIQI